MSASRILRRSSRWRQPVPGSGSRPNAHDLAPVETAPTLVSMPHASSCYLEDLSNCRTVRTRRDEWIGLTFFPRSTVCVGQPLAGETDFSRTYDRFRADEHRPRADRSYPAWRRASMLSYL